MVFHRFRWNLASLKFPPKNWKSQSGPHFGFFRGEIDHPPYFFNGIDRNSLSKSTKNRRLSCKEDTPFFFATWHKYMALLWQSTCAVSVYFDVQVSIRHCWCLPMSRNGSQINKIPLHLEENIFNEQLSFCKPSASELTSIFGLTISTIKALASVNFCAWHPTKHTH